MTTLAELVDSLQQLAAIEPDQALEFRRLGDGADAANFRIDRPLLGQSGIQSRLGAGNTALGDNAVAFGNFIIAPRH